MYFLQQENEAINSICNVYIYLYFNITTNDNTSVYNTCSCILYTRVHNKVYTCKSKRVFKLHHKKGRKMVPIWQKEPHSSTKETAKGLTMLFVMPASIRRHWSCLILMQLQISQAIQDSQYWFWVKTEVTDKASHVQRNTCSCKGCLLVLCSFINKCRETC